MARLEEHTYTTRRTDIQCYDRKCVFVEDEWNISEMESDGKETDHFLEKEALRRLWIVKLIEEFDCVHNNRSELQ